MLMLFRKDIAQCIVLKACFSIHGNPFGKWRVDPQKYVIYSKTSKVPSYNTMEGGLEWTSGQSAAERGQRWQHLLWWRSKEGRMRRWQAFFLTASLLRDLNKFQANLFMLFFSFFFFKSALYICKHAKWGNLCNLTCLFEGLQLPLHKNLVWYCICKVGQFIATFFVFWGRLYVAAILIWVNSKILVVEDSTIQTKSKLK